MAGQNGKKSSTTAATVNAKPERAPFVGYVNLTLTEKDKEDFTLWSGDNDVVDDAYFSSLELGYQFSIKQEPGKGGFMCSVSQFTVDRPDSGLIYTARSSTPAGALLKGIYVVSRKMAFDLTNGFVNRKNLDAF